MNVSGEAKRHKRASRFSYLDLGEEELPSESQKVSESVRHEDSRSHGGSVPKTKRAHRDDVFVGCNLFVRHPDSGSKRGWSMASPDLFVAFGMPPRRQRPRRSFVVWRQEGRKPDIVLEIASKKTRRRDAKEKPGVYAGLGVREHFLYDPDGVLRPELQGFALLRIAGGDSVQRCAGRSQRGAGPGSARGGGRNGNCAGGIRTAGSSCAPTRSRKPGVRPKPPPAKRPRIVPQPPKVEHRGKRQRVPRPRRKSPACGTAAATTSRSRLPCVSAS